MELYDSPADVVRKVLRARSIAPSEAAEAAGVDSRRVLQFLDGEFSTEVATALAMALDLDSEALVSLVGYLPKVVLPDGLTQLILPFSEDTVNAWLLENSQGALVVDAGAGSDDLRAALDARKIYHIHLLITHDHPDHIAGIRKLRSRISSLHRPTDLKPDTQFELGGFSIRSFDLSGHHPQALGYAIDGFGFAMGDALFAGSVGGCGSKPTYQLAKQTVVGALTGMPEDTLLLPGHGPPSTLAQERKHNPFVAAWLK